MKVRWMPAAKQDRAGAVDYIAVDNPRAAARMDQLFKAAAERLGNHPHAGRPGKIPGTRELIPHENYCMVYEIRNDTVWILALVHTARQWPPPVEESE